MSSLDSHRLLATIGAIHDRFVADRDDTACTEVLEMALRAGLELTGSAIGFIARITTIASGPVLSPECELAIDPKRHRRIIEWLRQTLSASAEGGTIPSPLARLARATEPMLLDYEPRMPALDNFMAIPLARHGKRWQPIAIFALANRPGGFSAELAQELGPLLGTCNTVLKAYEDASQRSAREREFERSEQRFRTFMDASPCIAYITDEDRRLVWASRAFGQQFAVDPREAVGRHEDELLPGGMSAHSKEIAEQVRIADGAVDMLEPIVDGQGVLHWWQGAKFPIDGAGGERLVGSLALDVSDNVRMTEVLREREDALAEAQELARVGRWTWSIERDHLQWDSQFERMVGIPSSEAHSIEDLYALIHPNDLRDMQRLVNHLRDTLEGREVLEHRILARGHVLDVQVVAQIRSELEEGPTLVAVVQDISDRRELERSRRELTTRASKYDSLSVLTAGVTGEFEELLVGILGNAGIALDDLDHNSLAAACVQDIEASAERSGLLVQQLSRYAGHEQLTRETLDLGALISDFAEELHATIAEHLTMRLSIHPEVPPTQGYRSQLRQLIYNLVVNGSEAIGANEGELVVEVGVGLLDAETLDALVCAPPDGVGEYTWVEVRDSGLGMDKQTAARIFEPFFTTKQAGRGLGLTAALSIVRGHGAGLALESSPGSGSRFRVFLPTAPAQQLTGQGRSWSRVLE